MTRRGASRWLFLVAGLLGVNAVGYADSVSSEFNFTATFVGGTCSISAPDNIQFNSGDILTFADIQAASEAGTPKTMAEFNVTLSNCAGWGGAPKITVTGAKTTDFGSTLFTDTNISTPSDAYGFGVYLMTPGNAFFNANNDLGFNGTITAANWSTTADLSMLNNMTLPMKAVLRCGNCSNQIARRGGNFKATVTFDFVYE